MSTEAIIGIVSMAIVAGIVLFVRFYRDRWASWPTLDEYWREHPECKSAGGVKCYRCSSADLAQRGWARNSDARRIHICNQCSTPLYRTAIGDWS
ncbi:hypothetical protein [Solimonas flava]|uniref:hypothetical protein n=1 Tax=Solimonas flava TaxID=415849 RepID=UPI0004217B7B|nr:hypothetical protein [Solimonas flava]